MPTRPGLSRARRRVSWFLHTLKTAKKTEAISFSGNITVYSWECWGTIMAFPLPFGLGEPALCRNKPPSQPHFVGVDVAFRGFVFQSVGHYTCFFCIDFFSLCSTSVIRKSIPILSTLLSSVLMVWLLILALLSHGVLHHSRLKTYLLSKFPSSPSLFRTDLMAYLLLFVLKPFLTVVWSRCGLGLGALYYNHTDLLAYLLKRSCCVTGVEHGTASRWHCCHYVWGCGCAERGETFEANHR